MHGGRRGTRCHFSGLLPTACRLKIETHHIRPLGVVCVHQHGVDDPFYRLLNHPLDDNLPPTIPVARPAWWR
jgi:hypothetical protein